jgi:hypothetical protein
LATSCVPDEVWVDWHPSSAARTMIPAHTSIVTDRNVDSGRFMRASDIE